MGTSHYSP